MLCRLNVDQSHRSRHDERVDTLVRASARTAVHTLVTSKGGGSYRQHVLAPREKKSIYTRLMRAPRCTAWAARLTSALVARTMSWPHPQKLFSGTSEAPQSVSRVSSVVGLHRGPARDNARVTSTASVELLGLHLPRAAAAAPVAMRSPSHTMCHQMRCVAHTMSPCATHHVPRTAYQVRAGGRHLPRGPAA